MPFTVLLRPAAERDYRRLSAALRRRIHALLMALEEEPRPAGTVKLTGHANRWRLRVGDYRILYTIDDREEAVTILRIVHRREAYR